MEQGSPSREIEKGLEEIEISDLGKSNGERDIDQEFQRVSETFQKKVTFARNGILGTYSFNTLAEEIIECNGEFSRINYLHELYKEVRGTSHPNYEKTKVLYLGISTAIDSEIKSRISED